MCPCKLIKSALLFTNPVLKNMLGKMRKRKEKEKREKRSHIWFHRKQIHHQD